MNPLQLEIIRQAAVDRDVAPYGQKAAVVTRAAKQLGMSEAHTKRVLSQHCSDMSLQIARPVRKRRSDANTCAISDKELSLVAGILSEGRRDNGKAMWTIEHTIDVLHSDGRLTNKLSAARVGALLRSRHMHPDQLAKPPPAATMSTPHPNYLWQQDASVCVIYHTPAGELQLMERQLFYKNKLEQTMKIVKELVVRYVITDHASGCIGVRYFLGGETTENALEALIWMIAQRNNRDGRGLPFYGVPQNLYTDQGSAFKSGLFTNFCATLDIKLKHHAARNARATGQVENAQNRVERGLEGTLRYLDATTLTMERLNDLASDWMNKFNGMQHFARHGMTRYGAWSLIDAKSQLRVVNDVVLLRTLPSTVPKRCRVSNDMLVSFVVKGHPSYNYDVRYVRGAAPGQYVMVAANPYKAPAVNVAAVDASSGETVWQEVSPVQYDTFGFPVDAPRYGEEYRSPPKTLVDERRNAISRQAYGTASGVPTTLEQADRARRAKKTPYLGQFNPLADQDAANVPAYIPRTGLAHEVVRRQASVEKLNHVVAMSRFAMQMKSAGVPFEPRAVFAWVQQRFPDSVPEDQIDVIVAQFCSIEPPRSDAASGLRAVGGGAA